MFHNKLNKHKEKKNIPGGIDSKDIGNFVQCMSQNFISSKSTSHSVPKLDVFEEDPKPWHLRKRHFNLSYHDKTLK